jgi:hypothetical protein
VEVWHTGNFTPASKAEKVHTHTAAEVNFNVALNKAQAATYPDIPKGYTLAEDAAAAGGSAPNAVVATLNHGANRIAQLSIGTNSDEFYWRGYRQADGNWKAWRRLWHSGNFDPSVKLNRNNDTFTGTHRMLPTQGATQLSWRDAASTVDRFYSSSTDNEIAFNSMNDAGAHNGVLFRMHRTSLACFMAGTLHVVGGINNGSSIKLKHIDGPLPYGLSEVERMQTATGRYRKDYSNDSRQRLFLIAEQLAELIPEAVDMEGVEYQGERVPAIKIEQLLPVFANAISQLSGQVRELRATVSELKQRRCEPL